MFLIFFKKKLCFIAILNYRMILFLIATILMTFKNVLAFIHIVILIGHSKPCVGINPMTLFLANSSTSVGFQQHHDWLPFHIVCFLKISCLFEPKCSSVKPLKRQVLDRFHQFLAPKNPVNSCECSYFCCRFEPRVEFFS